MSIVIIATILSPSFFTPTSTAANPPQAPKLTAKSSTKLTDGVTKTVLANGLTVLTKESRKKAAPPQSLTFKFGIKLALATKNQVLQAFRISSNT